MSSAIPETAESLLRLQALDDLCLLRSGAILTELELRFQTLLHFHFKTYNMLHHAASGNCSLNSVHCAMYAASKV